ncbi:MAG TPA: hypothetical protein VNN19_10980 [bacterium]|nr:hypothetical protein [bacterium]
MARGAGRLTLQDGSRVGIIGGGPAGSLCAFFLLRFSRVQGIALECDIYEPRDFTAPGPRGCNMCGGIVSELLVQSLAVDGITLPPSVVQRGIDSYVLNTDEEAVTIATPMREKRIAAVHRGGGPRDLGVLRWGGLDGHLLSRAQELGTRLIPHRISDVSWDAGRPRVRFNGGAATYDLLVVATGVNMPEGRLYAQLGLPRRPARTTRAYITELKLGYDAVTQRFGSAMHVFFLSIPRLEFAAIIPKGDFVTVCLLGRHVDQDLIRTFFESPAVRRCLPPPYLREGFCHCRPHINVREAVSPFADRVVLVGDAGVTRLYKDGIGAAYRTAKAAAATAVFHGVSATDFRRHYWPVYRAIARDNWFGRMIFAGAGPIRGSRLLRAAVARTVIREQESPTGRPRRLSVALWDMFTGSAPYRGIFYRLIDPRLLARLVWEGARTSSSWLLATPVRNGPPSPPSAPGV